jgi:mannose-6-phosphate isomerase-like protein (cupin superfamily)
MVPELVRAGEGEVISDDENRSLLIKAGREELALTWSRYEVGESGPGAHVHREHADCFLVLDGQLVFELGADGEIVRAGAGTFALVPPNVVHTFRNEGPGTARFLNVHAPSCGFHEHLKAMRDGRDEAAERFDTYDPPADGGRPPSECVVRGPEHAVRCSREDGIGSLALVESTLPPGFSTHRAGDRADSFWVLEGRLHVDTAEAGAGDYVLAPPGLAHTIENHGEKPVRLMNVVAPAGFGSLQ